MKNHEKFSNQERMKELCNILNEAAELYYQKNEEIMSNKEYDALYDELEKLEQSTGIIFSNSPTQRVGYEVVSQLPKVQHETKMLSLDKTKEISKLKDFLGREEGVLSWKLDGLTIVLTYRDGNLVQAVTRGNGTVGELVTNNAKVFSNIPLSIEYEEELVLRGEAVITYSDFKKINEKLEADEQYKNPRNLCSGTVRQLNNKVTAERSVRFYAFQVVQSTAVDFVDKKSNQLNWLEELGFEVVEHEIVYASDLDKVIEKYEEQIVHNDFGSDGLVLTINGMSLSKSLGTTSKFPKDSIAFKWSDEIKETKLTEIEWNTSRTGLINPVAIFEPVELEGTTVSRASVHNVSILKELELGEGDTIEVYKANMIIPQVAENKTRSNNIEIPETCPRCGGKTELKRLKDVEALYCTNDYCGAKILKAFAHFVGRNAMNIEGLSEATLEKFIDRSYLDNFGDIYRLERYKEEIITMEGFGEKSYNRLINSVEKSKNVEMPNLIYALGIQNVGLSNARLLCDKFDYDFLQIKEATLDDLIAIEGYGEILAQSVFNYFHREQNLQMLDDLLTFLEVKTVEKADELKLEGKTFVITGSVEKYDNRNALKKEIESLGGKVTGTVSKNTDYLINNDKESTSSKNKKAKTLGIPIISEDDYITLLAQK